MMIEVCNKPNIVYFWLSYEEKQNADFYNSIESQRSEWNKKGYRVCTFVSGQESIVESTKELLVHNKNISLEVNGEIKITAEKESAA